VGTCKTNNQRHRIECGGNTRPFHFHGAGRAFAEELPLAVMVPAFLCRPLENKIPYLGK
jgi:hypothetical protein